MDCVRPEELLDILYDDPDSEARPRIQAHLHECSACRQELASLQQARGALQAWRGVEQPRPQVGRRPAAWMLAAAAGIVLALGAAFGLSGSELRFEDGQFAFRLGRAADADVHALLAQQQARHSAELASLRAELSQGVESGLLREVQRRIRESEERNALLVGASLAELSERYETQRRYDLARVSASLSYLDGRTGQQLARTSELMGVMLRAADEQQ
jgi:hypothetical protein